MPRYLRIPKADARRLGVPAQSTVAVKEVPNYLDLPSDMTRIPAGVRRYRCYRVFQDNVFVGDVHSLSGWPLAKHP